MARTSLKTQTEPSAPSTRGSPPWLWTTRDVPDNELPLNPWILDSRLSFPLLPALLETPVHALGPDVALARGRLHRRQGYRWEWDLTIWMSCLWCRRE